MSDPAPEIPPARLLLRLAMRRAPVVPERLRTAAILGGLLVVWTLWPWSAPPPGVVVTPPNAPLVLALYLGVLLAIFLVHLRLVRSPRPEAIELREDALVLPREAGSAHAVTLSYAAVWGCDILDAKRPRLVFHTSVGGFEYPLDAMDDPALVRRARAVVRERLAALADDASLREFDERAAIGATVFSRMPRQPLALVGALVGVYGVELVTGAVDRPFQMIRLGASVPSLVRAGELYRLVSANLLHGNLLHLALNGVSLFSLAVALDYVLGPSRVLLVCLVSGLVGVSASAASGRALMSVGSSAAVFGLVGALLWVHLVHGRMLPAELRQTRRSWGTMALVNTALPLMLPMIDWRAHAAGLVAGGVIGWLTTPDTRVLDPTAPTPRAIRGAAVFMALVYVAGAGMAARAARRPWQVGAATVLAALTRDEAPAEQLNELAWYAAAAPDATPRLLRAAEAAAAMAVAHSANPALRDTRAQALHRLGRWDEAIPVELGALDRAEADPGPGFYATQLARFLAARSAARGPWVEGAEAASVTWTAGAVTVTLPARTQGRRVAVLAREGSALKALVLVCFGPGAPATLRVAVPGGAAGWRAELALVRVVERCEGAAAGRAFGMEPEALGLP